MEYPCYNGFYIVANPIKQLCRTVKITEGHFFFRTLQHFDKSWIARLPISRYIKQASHPTLPSALELQIKPGLRRRWCHPSVAVLVNANKDVCFIELCKEQLWRRIGASPRSLEEKWLMIQ